MKWFWRVCLAIFLAQGWLWTNYLKEWGLVTEKQRLFVLVAASVGFVVQQVILNKPKPATRREVEDRRQIIENCLASLHREFSASKPVKKAQIKAQIKTRVNVMLPTGDILDRSLKIHYFHCPSGWPYKNEERDMRWRKGYGTVGEAWKTGNVTFFDAVNPDFQGPIAKLSEAECKVVDGVKSVMAVPIIGKSAAVVGVLTLDSQQPISETKFDDPVIIALAQSYANNLEPIVFPHGVAG